METLTHKGPNMGMLAVIFTLLFNLGLYFVISFTPGRVYYPGPWEPVSVITDYFRNQPRDVLLCGFFQFCAAIPLALFTVNALSRMRFLGIKAAGPYIALAGGLMTAVNLALSALLLWTMAYPAVASNPTVIPSLYYIVFAIGGVGYSVPLGLLIAGIAVSGGLTGKLPKWLMWSGVALAIIGEASCLSLVFPALLPLIPLTRFPGFVWLIITGFKLPGTRVQPQGS